MCYASSLPSSLFINFLGPSRWNETFEMCDHGKQSPIDISSPMTDRILDRIRFHGYNQMPSTITARHDYQAGEWIKTTSFDDDDGDDDDTMNHNKRHSLSFLFNYRKIKVAKTAAYNWHQAISIIPHFHVIKIIFNISKIFRQSYCLWPKNSKDLAMWKNSQTSALNTWL